MSDDGYIKSPKYITDRPWIKNFFEKWESFPFNTNLRNCSGVDDDRIPYNL